MTNEEKLSEIREYIYGSKKPGGGAALALLKEVKQYIDNLEQENENLKKLLEEIRNITQTYTPLKAGDITSNIKDYIAILDILKPYIIVEDLNGCYWLRIGGNGYDKYLVYKITKEQYELLKEWLE